MLLRKRERIWVNQTAGPALRQGPVTGLTNMLRRPNDTPLQPPKIHMTVTRVNQSHSLTLERGPGRSNNLPL